MTASEVTFNIPTATFHNIHVQEKRKCWNASNNTHSISTVVKAHACLHVHVLQASAVCNAYSLVLLYSSLNHDELYSVVHVLYCTVFHTSYSMCLHFPAFVL